MPAGVDGSATEAAREERWNFLSETLELPNSSAISIEMSNDLINAKWNGMRMAGGMVGGAAGNLCARVLHACVACVCCVRVRGSISTDQ